MSWILYTKEQNIPCFEHFLCVCSVFMCVDNRHSRFIYFYIEKNELLVMPVFCELAVTDMSKI